MKIKDIAVNVYSCIHDPEVLLFWCGYRVEGKRDIPLVKITTDEGFVGYGEAYQGNDVSNVLPSFQKVASGLLGEDPLDIPGIWLKVAKIIPDEAQRNIAMAPFDTALHDIDGKVSGKSVSELLGTRRRDRVKVYASAGLIYRSIDRYVKEALAVVEMGFKGYKLKLGQGPAEDVKIVKAVRDAIGEEMALMVDGHYWFMKLGGGWYMYSPKSIRWMAREFEKLDIHWLEEPFPHAEIGMYKDFKEACPNIRIATGESAKTLSEYKALLESGAVDVVQGEPIQQGGLTMCKQITDLSTSMGKQFVPHAWSTRFAVASTLQLLATLTDEQNPWQEYTFYTTEKGKGLYTFPLADEILAEPMRIEDGYMSIPNKPGLGVEISEAALKKHPRTVGPSHYIVSVLPFSHIPESPFGLTEIP